MKVLIFVLFLIFAGLSFYAGYELGRSASQQVVTATSDAVENPDSTPEVNTRPQEEPIEDEVVKEKFPPLPEQQQLEAISEESLAARARSQYVTLVDNQGRDIVVEILRAGNNTLKVRRMADSLVVDIPLDMLSREDRLFAEYLEKITPNQLPGQGAERGPDINERDLVKLIRDQFSGSRFR